MKRGMVFRIVSETGEEGARCWSLLGDRRSGNARTVPRDAEWSCPDAGSAPAWECSLQVIKLSPYESLKAQESSSLSYVWGDRLWGKASAWEVARA